jgi:two-component system cell cycle sensor histidine kinase/response regulator CckA
LIAAASDALPIESELLRPESILVVDDEASFREAVVRQLKNAGYDTIEARDGSEAIKQFAERREEITAVLLDLVMPNTSGGETLAILRYYEPTLPVVVTSGYSELDALSLRETERGVGFLGKPFTATELTTELRRVISERLPKHRHSTPPKPLF